jgi:hypothetical protein
VATPRVDLDAINSLAEIVVRGGNVHDPRARQTLQQAYQQHMSFPDVQGLSVVFRERASLDELARAAQLPYPKLSYSVISLLRAELRIAGYEMVLYITPSRRLPDHHTLAVATGGSTLPSLPLAAADALIRTLIVVDNPYRQP